MSQPNLPVHIIVLCTMNRWIWLWHPVQLLKSWDNTASLESSEISQMVGEPIPHSFFNFFPSSLFFFWLSQYCYFYLSFVFCAIFELYFVNYNWGGAGEGGIFLQLNIHFWATHIGVSSVLQYDEANLAGLKNNNLPNSLRHTIK